MRAIVSLKPTPAGDYDRREGSSPRPASATAPSRVAPRRCGMVKSPAARYPTSLPVVFSAPETFQPGYAANISAGGMFLRPGGSGAGVGIQFMASDDPVRRRVDRYIELLAETTLALQRPKRTHYPRLQAPVYWTPVGLPLFRRRKTSIEDLGGVLVYLDEKLKEGARLKIEVFLPDGTSVVCKAEVDWIDRLPQGAPARFEVGLKFTAIAPRDRERLSAVLQEA